MKKLFICLVLACLAALVLLPACVFAAGPAFDIEIVSARNLEVEDPGCAYDADRALLTISYTVTGPSNAAGTRMVAQTPAAYSDDQAEQLSRSAMERWKDSTMYARTVPFADRNSTRLDAGEAVGSMYYVLGAYDVNWGYVGHVIVKVSVARPTDSGTIIDSGTCGMEGGNLTWKLDGSGLLTIKGSGAMENFPDFNGRGCMSGGNSSDIWEVVVEEGVTTIGNSAFREMKNLQAVTLPTTLEMVDAEAFQGSSSLAEIFIPRNVYYISDGEFYACTSLMNINVDPANEAYCSEDGVLFTKDKKTLLDFPGGRMGSYAVPDGVETLYYASFSMDLIETVELPESLKTIGPHAFSRCDTLKSIRIPAGVETIETSAFGQCAALENFSVAPGNANYSSPGGMLCTKDGKTLLQGTIGGKLKVQIPDGVETISSSAFFNCSKLLIVSIPASVTRIDMQAFYLCRALQSVYYGGTEAEWAAVVIDKFNDPLFSAALRTSFVDKVEKRSLKTEAEETVEVSSSALFEEVAVSGDVTEEAPVVVASYDAEGRFLGLAVLTCEGSACPEEDASDVKVFWVGEDSPRAEDAQISLE